MYTEILKHIYKHPLLSEIDYKIIIESHQLVEFKKGDSILKEKTVADEYYILISGVARSFVYNYEMDDITTDFFVNNNIIIEVASLFQRIPSSENIEAVTDCICWKIEFDIFQELFHSLTGFREWGRAWLSNSLFQYKQKILSMMRDSATNRYKYLLQNKSDIIQNVPLKQIASYLGITDTSLSRIRKEIVNNQ